MPATATTALLLLLVGSGCLLSAGAVSSWGSSACGRRASGEAVSGHKVAPPGEILGFQSEARRRSLGSRVPRSPPSPLRNGPVNRRVRPGLPPSPSPSPPPPSLGPPHPPQPSLPSPQLVHG